MIFKQTKLKIKLNKHAMFWETLWFCFFPHETLMFFFNVFDSIFYFAFSQFVTYEATWDVDVFCRRIIQIRTHFSSPTKAAKVPSGSKNTKQETNLLFSFNLSSQKKLFPDISFVSLLKKHRANRFTFEQIKLKQQKHKSAQFEPLNFKHWVRINLYSF